MALKDLMKNIGGVFSRVSADITRRPDGGTSHYRPLRKKTAEPQYGEMPPAQNTAQDPQYVHTGFTGMNPPTFFGGYDQQTAYGQTAYGQTAYGQTAYGQTAFGQTAYGQPAGNTAFQQPAWDQQAGNQTNYFRQDPAPQQNYVGKGSFSGQTGFTMAGRNNNISFIVDIGCIFNKPRIAFEHSIPDIQIGRQFCGCANRNKQKEQEDQPFFHHCFTAFLSCYRLFSSSCT